MKISIIVTVLLLSLSVVDYSQAAETDNPLKKEMRLLDEAFKNLVDALIHNRPESIEEPFHRVHAAKKNTEKALHKGEITLPKNGESLEAFVSMDEAFHENLKELLAASRKREMGKIKALTHDILDQCIRCHEVYKE